MKHSKPNWKRHGIRSMVIGGIMALVYCAILTFGPITLATHSPHSAVVIQEEETKTAAETDVEKKTAKDKSAEGQGKQKSAAERRREALMKGRVNENEDRPEKPTFKDRPKSTGGISDISFDDIKFEMEKSERFSRKMLTDEINVMDGTRINLRGYIRPSTRQKNLTKFVFVRDNKECCFGPGAALYDCVLVKLATGQKSDYTVRPVTIQGDFYLKEYLGPDGKIWAVYRMKNGVIK